MAVIGSYINTTVSDRIYSLFATVKAERDSTKKD